MKSFKEFTQSMTGGYDWGTTKAAKHALKLTPGQDKKRSYTTKEVHKAIATNKT